MKNFLASLAVLAVFAFSGTASGDIVLWSIDDGVGNGGMPVTSVADPTGSGMGNVGQVVMASGTNQWTNFNSGVMDTTVYAGEDWEFTIDLYVPQASLTAGIDDNFYYNFFDGVQAGFTDFSTLPADTWTTITWNGTVGAGAANDNLLFLSNNQATYETGLNPTFYFDNVEMVIVQAAVVPEPSSTTLLGLAMGAFAIRRRRR